MAPEDENTIIIDFQLKGSFPLAEAQKHKN